jgi:hypothetical protein
VKLYNVYYTLGGEPFYLNIKMVGKDQSDACRNALDHITEQDPCCLPKIVGYEELKNDAKDLH